ncbi:hypothetical protein DMUE_4613 [Dictyocoela muelleri]|nr:hypothetical protein DMUE_4613 [Dictyocoela muelleri]
MHSKKPFSLSNRSSYKNNHRRNIRSGADEIVSASQHNALSNKEKKDAAQFKKSDFDNITFKKGMSAKEVKMNIFLLEGTIGFESYSLRERMTLLMNHSDILIREWFFQ